MAKLSTKARNKLPKSEFGLPGQRKYPMEDAAHAKNAKARATQMENKGKLSASSKAKIDAKANRILDKGERGSRGQLLITNKESVMAEKMKKKEEKMKERKMDRKEDKKMDKKKSKKDCKY